MRKFTLTIYFFIMVFIISGCNNSLLGGADYKNVKIDFGQSELYSQQDMNAAIKVILNKFKTWNGCTLYTITYTNDERSKENVSYCNRLKHNANFTEAIVFESSFHTPKNGNNGFNPDEDYEGWSWFLAREGNGSWELLTWGYG